MRDKSILWDELKVWLEEEVVKKYEESNDKYGEDGMHYRALARGIDSVLIKMEDMQRQ